MQENKKINGIGFLLLKRKTQKEIICAPQNRFLYLTVSTYN